MPDGSERLIGYAPRTLIPAEKKYSQVEKEGLACVFGEQLYSYLFGHSFQLITDHKPLLGLLRECKSTSPQASARVRRYSLYLSQFEYHLTFRRTSAHANADALSRLPLPTSTLSQLSRRWCYYSNIWMTLQSLQNRLQKRLVRTLCYPLWSCTQGKACLTQLILTLNYDHILTGS